MIEKYGDQLLTDSWDTTDIVDTKVLSLSKFFFITCPLYDGQKQQFFKPKWHRTNTDENRHVQIISGQTEEIFCKYGASSKWDIVIDL